MLRPLLHIQWLVLRPLLHVSPTWCWGHYNVYPPSGAEATMTCIPHLVLRPLLHVSPTWCWGHFYMYPFSGANVIFACMPWPQLQVILCMPCLVDMEVFRSWICWISFGPSEDLVSTRRSEHFFCVKVKQRCTWAFGVCRLAFGSEGKVRWKGRKKGKRKEQR